MIAKPRQLAILQAVERKRDSETEERRKGAAKPRKQRWRVGHQKAGTSLQLSSTVLHQKSKERKL